MIDPQRLRCVDLLPFKRDQVRKRHAALCVQAQNLFIAGVRHLHDVLAQLDLGNQFSIHDLRRKLVNATQSRAVQ